MDEEIEIEKLPTLGAPYSMKTYKQGRVATLSELNLLERLSSGMINNKGENRRKKTASDSRINAICGRILRFKKTTEEDRETVRKFIDGDRSLIPEIFKINKKLWSTHWREFRNG